MAKVTKVKKRDNQKQKNNLGMTTNALNKITKESLQYQKQKHHKDSFFVGYAKTPNRNRRFLLGAIPLMIMAMGGLGGLIAAKQKKPAAATWGKRSISLRGRLIKEPYPHLLVANNYAQKGYDTVFLVQKGKQGFHKIVRHINDKYISVQGRLLSRHDIRNNYLLESDPSLSVIKGKAAIGNSKINDLGTHTLTGRIMDSKCYFGVMKPSDGMTHKACASLCVRGGIPPIFVPQETHLDRIIIVTLNQNYYNDISTTTPHTEPFLRYMLDWIKIKGRLLAFNNHYEFQIDPTTVKPVAFLSG